MVIVFFPVETLSGCNFPLLAVIDNGPVINLFANATISAQLPVVTICWSSQHEEP